MQKNKTQKIIFTIIATLSLLLLAYFWGKNKSKSYHYLQGNVFGTYFHIVYEANKSYASDIDSLFIAFDNSLSTYNPNSIISKVNRNEDVVLDPYFVHLFNEAIRCAKDTDGAFDMTITPLVDAWGFGSGKKLKNIDKHTVDSLMQYVGMEKVSLQDGRVLKENPLLKLNVNAIAKGYGVDVIADYLEAQGIKNYLVEIGGEIRAKGKNERQKIWSTAINKPIDDSTQMQTEIESDIVLLADGALATSGNYRNFYIRDGQKYAHTINPKTGYPTSHELLSATVVTENCLRADALATAFMVLGLEKSIALAKKLDVAVYFIYSEEGENKHYMSESLKKLLRK